MSMIGRIHEGELEVLGFHVDKKGDTIATHRLNGRIGHSIVRWTPSGESYFITHCQRVYTADLRRKPL